jgi:hypothetical protein
MDFARSRPDTGTGGRGGGAALASVPARRGRRDGPSREPPATPGAARQRWQRVCTGFPGCFSSGGSLRRVVAGVVGGWLLPLCVGETASGGALPRHSHATGGSHPHTAEDGEARRRNFPRSPGSAGRRQEPAAENTEHPGTGHQDPAARAARGDGELARREQRHRSAAAAASPTDVFGMRA